jgi:hypothetical protein
LLVSRLALLKVVDSCRRLSFSLLEILYLPFFLVGAWVEVSALLKKWARLEVIGGLPRWRSLDSGIHWRGMELKYWGQVPLGGGGGGLYWGRVGRGRGRVIVGRWGRRGRDHFQYSYHVLYHHQEHCLVHSV